MLNVCLNKRLYGSLLDNLIFADKGHCTTSRRFVDSSIPPQVVLPLQWAGLVWRRREGGGEEKDLAMIKSEAAHSTFSPRTGRNTAVSETQL